MAVDSGGKWRFDGVSNESTTCQRVTRGQFKCRRSLAPPLLPTLSLSVSYSLSLSTCKSLVSPSCSFLSFPHSLSQFAWLDFSFAFCFITLRALPLSKSLHPSLSLSLSLPSICMMSHCNTSINYFLLDHPQSLCISAVAGSTPPPFSFFSLSSPFLHLSRRFSLPLANCVNQFDQLTDSQRAPLWQTLIAPQQRQQQPRLGL